MSHLVSIIMPAYNAEKYIAASIRSAMEQTYANWELIVVDDGSTDGTAGAVKAFAAVDDRVKYLYQPNGRQGRARNNGIAHSKGTLIAFLDSDDLWVREKLEVQLKAFAETDADLVFSDGFIFDGDDVRDESRTFSPPRGRLQGPALFDLLFIHNHIPILSVVLRKSLWDRAGQFGEGHPYDQGSEDYDLWLRLARHGAVFYGLGERLVRYRRHPSSATHFASDMLGPMLAVVKKHMGDSSLGDRRARRRVRSLHRDLISALVQEGKLPEARRRMEELREWDAAGVVTPIQNLLLRLSPRFYNFISRECLYRAEWHLSRVLDKLSSA